MTKKILVFFLLFLLTNCNTFDETLPDEIPNQNGPNLYGVEDVTITLQQAFDPLEGVIVYDVKDGYITDLLQVEGNVDIEEIGIYFLKYRVKDSSNNETLHLRYVTVERSVSDVTNVFSYGQFDEGLSGYDIFQETGVGHANFSVKQGVLEIELLSVQDGIWYRPRLNTWGIEFEKNKTYRIEFDAMALSNRMIQVQVGELLAYEPWFDKFDSTSNTFDIITEWTTFNYDFLMSKDTNNNGSVLFEFGDIAGDQSLTTIYLDNIKIYEYE